MTYCIPLALIIPAAPPAGRVMRRTVSTAGELSEVMAHYL